MRILPSHFHFVSVFFVLTVACGESDVATTPTEALSFVAADSPGPGVSRFDLGTLGGATSTATDIDASGRIVGVSLTAAGETRGFIWTEEEGMLELPPLPGHDRSTASKLLRDGRVFGGSSGPGDVAHVIWSRDRVPARVEPPTPPPGTQNFGLHSVNQRGAMVGVATINGFQTGWYWSPTAGFVDIKAVTPGKSNETWALEVNQTGYVLGFDRPRDLCDFRPGEFGGLCIRVYLWREDSGYIFIGSPDHSARTEMHPGGVNDGGEVAGWADYFGRGSQPFRWSQGEGFTLLSTPEGEGSAAGLNNKGTVVGAVSRPGQAARAAAWTRSGARVELALPDSLPSGAAAVNDRDVVVGVSPFNGALRATRWTIDRH
jgi:probable HAF family extracellular repeat protein